MKKMTWLFFALISIVLISVSIFTSFAPKYVSGSYYDSENFYWFFEDKIQEIGPVLLSRLDVDKEIENLQVEPYEVEEYLNFNGTQMNQIQSIQDQYQEMINDAEVNDNTVLKEEMVKERDTKIADIRANFADDKTVREKILSAKKEVLRKYDAKISNAVVKAKVSQKSLAYDLTNVDTGERYTFGDVNEDAAYRGGFSNNNGYLTVSSLDQDFSEVKNSELQALSIYNLNELVGDESSQFTGEIIIPKSEMTNEHLQGFRQYEQNKTLFTLSWILGLLSAAVAYWLYTTRRNEILLVSTPQWVKNLNFEGRIVSILVTSVGLLNTYFPLTQGMSYDHFENIVNTLFLYLFLVAFLTLTIVQLIWLFNDSKNNGLKELWETSRIKRMNLKMQDVFLNRSLGIQMVMLLFVVFLSGLGLGGVLLQPVLILVYAPLFLFVSLPILYLLFKRVANYNKLAIATEQLSKGQLSGDLNIRGKSVFAEHAKHLNTLRTGVRTSQSEQAKSERLKTELITNVSHDLRTPLTSIITYTDLLKNPDLTTEERQSYVTILDRKSQRLKTLIEDLFEVSKMASGNMQLNKQRVDLTQLMQQALAEHEEAIQKSGLDFRITTPEIKLFAYVDGQKWWRVLDNLIGNAIKYTMPGTRVYVALKEEDGCAQFIVKNVTKYELGDNIDELFERFKRSDTSRHTEGSGLGLAIAQSIVDLHGGIMSIDVDGDLFKATVSIQIN
ncbi:sensor histidine kinase [Paenisporosarcina sp. TG-14]|uniref:sensor histidine kinase n=1 Tax=Paenisporosarcina sp. TG-14 TaxID=1231057 RepID=UPI0002E4C098|nr:HAMP domain-containing sensor histidine kinase [Paenisporosarcina sp. TG-14]